MEHESLLIEQMRRTLARLEAAMAAIHDALAITNARGQLLWCAENLLGGRLYDDAIADQQEQSQLILQTLRRALSGQSLELHLQPIRRLSSGEISGHEALVRLRREDGSC